MRRDPPQQVNETIGMAPVVTPNERCAPKPPPLFYASTSVSSLSLLKRSEHTLRSPSPHVKLGTAGTAQSSRSHAVAMMTPVAVALALLAVSSLQPRPAVQAQVSAAPAAAPAPGWGALDCTGALLNLSTCLTYVEDGSALTRPEKGCCGALSGVVDGEAACLCELVGGYGTFGVRVDAVRALALPTICRVEAPPPRLCAALGLPVAEPPGGAGPKEPGHGVPAAATPATSDATAMHRSRVRHLRLVLLPCCVAISTLLL